MVCHSSKMKKKQLNPTLIITLIIFLIDGCTSTGVMSDMRVSCKIESRYAQTTVISTMKNPEPESSELVFKMALPKHAFISSFVMEIHGENYTSLVKTKEEAKQTYESAKKRGNTAGIVEQRENSNKMFEISTNVEAGGKVIFYLKYEQLLSRVKGIYTYNTRIKPGHVIPEVSIDVHIIETEAIKDLKILELPGKEQNYGDFVTESRPSENEIMLSYSHSNTDSDVALDGSFSITYDVNTKPDGGEMQIAGDYFVHHFSPEGLPKMPVHTIFVIDVSGSMFGGPLEQVKEAMEAILRDLQIEDTFEIIKFSSDVHHIGSFRANKPGKMKALGIIRELEARGATNLYDAYMESVRKITAVVREKTAKQIVFLTDGTATSGQRNSKIIRTSVLEANIYRHPIFGLAFGSDADFNLLNEISSDNRGFARQIVHNEDAKDQLKGFYEEISTPLLTEINFKYNENEIDMNTLVKQGITNFYSGAEVVLAGKLDVDVEVVDVKPIVTGIGKKGPLQFPVERLKYSTESFTSDRDNFIARLWAYLMVQDILHQMNIIEDTKEKETLKKEATEIALAFNFVTKLTSLVVVRPEDDMDESNYDEVEEDEEELEEDYVYNYPTNYIHSIGNSSLRVNFWYIAPLWLMSFLLARGFNYAIKYIN